MTKKLVGFTYIDSRRLSCYTIIKSKQYIENSVRHTLRNIIIHHRDYTKNMYLGAILVTTREYKCKRVNNKKENKNKKLTNGRILSMSRQQKITSQTIIKSKIFYTHREANKKQTSVSRDHAVENIKMPNTAKRIW